MDARGKFGEHEGSVKGDLRPVYTGDFCAIFVAAIQCSFCRAQVAFSNRMCKGRFRRYDFAYDYRMRHAYAMTTTRIASCKSTYNIFTTDAHNTKNVGTVLSHAIFCSARCLRRAKIAYNSHHITLYLPAIVVEKHVFKILRHFSCCVCLS